MCTLDWKPKTIVKKILWHEGSVFAEVYMQIYETVTSSSLRMLHSIGVTLAGLDGGIFSVSSSAADFRRSSFLDDMTTLHPTTQDIFKSSGVKHFSN